MIYQQLRDKSTSTHISVMMDGKNTHAALSN